MGQMILVIPELELVIACLAGNCNQLASLIGFRDRYVGDFILRVTGP